MAEKKERVLTDGIRPPQGSRPGRLPFPGAKPVFLHAPRPGSLPAAGFLSDLPPCPLRKAGVSWLRRFRRTLRADKFFEEEIDGDKTGMDPE